MAHRFACREERGDARAAASAHKICGGMHHDSGTAAASASEEDPLPISSLLLRDCRGAARLDQPLIAARGADRAALIAAAIERGLKVAC